MGRRRVPFDAYLSNGTGQHKATCHAIEQREIQNDPRIRSLRYAFPSPPLGVGHYAQPYNREQNVVRVSVHLTITMSHLATGQVRINPQQNSVQSVRSVQSVLWRVPCVPLSHHACTRFSTHHVPHPYTCPARVEESILGVYCTNVYRCNLRMQNLVAPQVRCIVSLVTPEQFQTSLGWLVGQTDAEA